MMSLPWVRQVPLLSITVLLISSAAPLRAQTVIGPRQSPLTTQLVTGTVWASIGRSIARRAQGAFVVVTDETRSEIIDGSRTDSEGTFSVNVPLHRGFELVACVRTSVGLGLGFRRVSHVAQSSAPVRMNLNVQVTERRPGPSDVDDSRTGNSPLAVLEVMTRYLKIGVDRATEDLKGPPALQYCRTRA